MTQQTGRNRLLKAMRTHTVRHIEQRPLQVSIGTVASTVDDSSGFTVEIPDHGITLDADNLLVAQTVAQYDADYGLDTGDSIALLCTAAGDWVAVGVMTAAEATDRGASFFAGTSPPGAGVGADGDFFLDTAHSMIYGPKASGAWPAGTNLVGATGPTGATGSTGATGPTGPAGPGFDVPHPFVFIG